MTCRPTYSSSQKHHPAKPDFFLFALGFGLAVALAGLSLSRGTSDALSPMWSLLAATLVGTVCTPLLVAGTSLGTAGVAVSALVAQLAALTVLIWRWHRDGNPLAPGAGWQEWKPSTAIAKRMLRIGLPAALQMLATALAEIVLLGLVNRRGSSATADYGAATQILSWVQLPAMRLGIAAAIFSGHAVGAGRRVELPVAVVLEARFGLAGVFRACPAAFLDMLVLHGLYYRYKEKIDG